jgi:hypothetical protein
MCKHIATPVVAAFLGSSKVGVVVNTHPQPPHIGNHRDKLLIIAGAYENNIEFTIEEERESLPMSKVKGDEDFKLEGVGEINIDDI